MTNRKKKIFIIQTLLFLVAIILIYQTYYTEENSNLIEKEITVKETVKEADLKKILLKMLSIKGLILMVTDILLNLKMQHLTLRHLN